MKITGSGSASGSESGSIGQRHGAVDPDPDPHQNVMDPQHGCKVYHNFKKTMIIILNLWFMQI